ncbi:hypothetical protein [Mycolicibacterium sp. A43C]
MTTPGTFGAQTVGVVTATSVGEPGYLGLRTSTRSVTLRHGVHFRRVQSDEEAGVTNTDTEFWKLTDGPDIAALAKSTGVILYDGTDDPQWDDDDETNRFQIHAPAVVKHDFSGPHHATVMCKRQAT